MNHHNDNHGDSSGRMLDLVSLNIIVIIINIMFLKSHSYADNKIIYANVIIIKH